MAPQRMAVNISITPELDSFLQKRVSEPSRARSATAPGNVKSRNAMMPCDSSKRGQAEWTPRNAHKLGLSEPVIRSY